MSTSFVDLDWNAWRELYGVLTFADQVAFYEDVARLYPHQEHANVVMVQEAFDLIDEPLKVVTELGGWNGRLASRMLPRGDIGLWVNHDLVEVPQVRTDALYRLHVLQDYLWNGTPDRNANVFVACHTIEHLSAAHFRQLVDWLTTPWVYLEAPLEDDPHDWTDYQGSHILEIGWDGVHAIMGARGYEPFHPGLWHREQGVR